MTFEEWYNEQQGFTLRGERVPPEGTDVHWLKVAFEEGQLSVVEEEKSLRDEFAMAALNGMLSGARGSGRGYDDDAKRAYYRADAMMKARKNSA